MAVLTNFEIPDKTKDPKAYLKYIYSIRNKMRDYGFTLVYEGQIDHNITKAFSSLTEMKMNVLEEEDAIKKKVFHVMVECLQNISKHSDEFINDHPEEDDSKGQSFYGNGIFIVAKDGQGYQVITGNKIINDKVQPLKEFVDHLLSLDKEGLKAIHKKTLREGVLSDKSGAGLGLIDIVRRSEGNVTYDFVDIGPNLKFFILITQLVKR